MSQRDMLEKNGRLTTGNAPLHIRRKHLSNGIRDNLHMVQTMLANWPAEFALPDDHPLHEWLEVSAYICDQLETPTNETANDTATP